MSILVIMGAAALLSAPFEAVRRPRKVRVYRKLDTAKRHKKSPVTFHSNGLSCLHLF